MKRAASAISTSTDETAASSSEDAAALFGEAMQKVDMKKLMAAEVSELDWTVSVSCSVM